MYNLKLTFNEKTMLEMLVTFKIEKLQELFEVKKGEVPDDLLHESNKINIEKYQRLLDKIKEI